MCTRESKYPRNEKAAEQIIPPLLPIINNPQAWNKMTSLKFERPIGARADLAELKYVAGESSIHTSKIYIP